jgi:Arc/MetJ-type ribon-helix-helix transcriptional regulator
MNVIFPIPKELESYVESQLQAGNYASAGEYFLALLQHDRQRKEAQAKLELEAKMVGLQEYVDLDEGKKLKISVVERLRRQQQSASIPAVQGMEKLGINWDEL